MLQDGGFNQCSINNNDCKTVIKISMLRNKHSCMLIQEKFLIITIFISESVNQLIKWRLKFDSVKM